MDFTHADAIDSSCWWCGGDASDWVERENGTRRYLCRECGEDLLRFDAAPSLADLADHPPARTCVGCDSPTLSAELHPIRRTCDECDLTDVQTVTDVADAMKQDELTEEGARAILEEAFGEDVTIEEIELPSSTARQE